MEKNCSVDYLLLIPVSGFTPFYWDIKLFHFQ